MGEYNIKTNIDEVNVDSLKQRLGAAFANYVIGQIKEMPSNMQMQVYRTLIQELEEKKAAKT